MERKQIVERTHQAFHMARTFTYLGEYKLLHSFTKLFRPWVEVPSEKQDKAIRPFILKDIEELFREDAKLFSSGLLPLPLLTPESPIPHAKRLARILYTGVKMSRMRKVRQSKPQASTEGLPEYFTRNFHWQVDGYLSDSSAAIYDHQVEILFSGTTAAMRRLVFPPLAEYLSKLGRKADLLEIAAGTGEISEAMACAFPSHNLTVTDLSAPYLSAAQKRLQGQRVNFVRAAAEALPFKDASQDVVYGVFLFHELPTDVREKALAEAHRVLRPGGLFVMVDSIQQNEVAQYAVALEKFPQDYHEPFYRSYTQWPVGEALGRHGFTAIDSKRGFFSKCVWGIKS